jgi:hypothetical protein
MLPQGTNTVRLRHCFTDEPPQAIELKHLNFLFLLKGIMALGMHEPLSHQQNQRAPYI